MASVGAGVKGHPQRGSVPAGFSTKGRCQRTRNWGSFRDRKIGKHRWLVTKGGGAVVVDVTPNRSRRPPLTTPLRWLTELQLGRRIIRGSTLTVPSRAHDRSLVVEQCSDGGDGRAVVSDQRCSRQV